MNALKNRIAVNTVAVVLGTIRNEELWGEAEAQRISQIWFDLKHAAGFESLHDFQTYWEADEDKELPQDENSDQLDEDLSKQIATLEMLYILTFASLIRMNHTSDVAKMTMAQKHDFIHKCAQSAYKTVKEALFEVYTEDNDVPYGTIRQAQRVIHDQCSDLMDHVNLIAFEDLTKLEEAVRIVSVANSILCWALELDSEFLNAYRAYS